MCGPDCKHGEGPSKSPPLQPELMSLPALMDHCGIDVRNVDQRRLMHRAVDIWRDENNMSDSDDDLGPAFNRWLFENVSNGKALRAIESHPYRGVDASPERRSSDRNWRADFVPHTTGNAYYSCGRRPVGTNVRLVGGEPHLCDAHGHILSAKTFGKLPKAFVLKYLGKEGARSQGHLYEDDFDGDTLVGDRSPGDSSDETAVNSEKGFPTIGSPLAQSVARRLARKGRSLLALLKWDKEEKATPLESKKSPTGRVKRFFGAGRKDGDNDETRAPVEAKKLTG